MVFLKKNIDKVLALSFILAYAVILSITYNFNYSLNDDSTLAAILSGSLTGSPDAHCVYILYPLAFIIKILYCIFPSVPVYDILSFCAYFVSGYLLISTFLEYLNEHSTMQIKLPVKLLLCCLLCSLGSLFLYEYVFQHYSVTATLLVSTGAFILILSNNKSKKDNSQHIFNFKVILSIALMVCGFLIRSQMVMLAAPIIFSGFAMKWFIEIPKYKKNFKAFFQYGFKDILPLIIVLFLSVIGMLINNYAYSQEPWSDFSDFNNARTEIYDYQRIFPSYEEHTDFYLNNNISYEEYVLLDHYDLTLYTNLNTNTLNSIINYNRNALNISYFPNEIKSTLLSYRYYITHFYFGDFSIAIFALYILLGLLYIMNKKLLGLVGLPLMFLCRSVSWLFPMLRGRAETRVTTSLFLCEAIILLALIAKEAVPKLSNKKSTVFLIILLTLASSYFVFTNVKEINSDLEVRTANDATYQSITDYCLSHPDNLYLLDIYKSPFYIEKMFARPNRDVNYILAGGWMTKSPIYEDICRKLTGNSFSGLADSTGNLYFIVDSERGYQFVEDYYTSLGYTGGFQIIDTIPAKNYEFYILHYKK